MGVKEVKKTIDERKTDIGSPRMSIDSSDNARNKKAFSGVKAKEMKERKEAKEAAKPKTCTGGWETKSKPVKMKNGNYKRVKTKTCKGWS